MAIYLIRHGETEFNTARILQLPETPLNRKGLAQADRLALRLAGENISDILCSDLVRAVMTAEKIRAATAAPLRLSPLLQERSYGDLRGMAYDAAGVDIFAPGYAPPGGERWEEFHARVDVMWNLVSSAVAECEGNLAVVTHGLVCHSLASRILRLPEGEEVPRIWSNTGLTIVDGHPPWTVRLLNCTRHLDAETADPHRVLSGL